VRFKGKIVDHGIRPGGELLTVDPPLNGKDKVEFGRHSLVQMEIRGISREDVLETLRCPTETGLPCDMFRSRVRRRLGRYKALDVVFEERDDRWLVITAMVKEFPKK
jgi:hypothetical protein